VAQLPSAPGGQAIDLTRLSLDYPELHPVQIDLSIRDLPTLTTCSGPMIPGALVV
jgi:hypothetical protein